MRTWIKKGLLEVVKILAVVGLSFAFFVTFQHQWTSPPSASAGASGGVAHALGAYHEELSEAKTSLLSAVESSQDQLQAARKSLERSAGQLEEQQRNLDRWLSEADTRIEKTLMPELAWQRNVLSEVRGRAEGNDVRIDTVEETVREILPSDPTWVERAIIYPTVQLKGDGTVGSGVLIYSVPTGGRAPRDGSRDAPKKFTSFAVTACHVVMEILGDQFPRGVLEDVRMQRREDPSDYEVHSASVEVYDKERDLALLRLKSTRKFQDVAKLLPRAQVRDLHLFTRVYAVGCPLGNSPLPTSGEISSKSKIVGERKFWMVNAPTFFGNSGGGIYDSKTCQLIGISSMIYTYGKEHPFVVPHMGLFVPIHVVYDWLEVEGYGFVLRGEALPDGLEGGLEKSITGTHTEAGGSENGSASGISEAGPKSSQASSSR